MRSHVKPRVVCQETHETIVLLDLVESLLETQQPLLVEVTGRAGSGKSTALATLASSPLASQLVIVDEPQIDELALGTLKSEPTARVIVYAATHTTLQADHCYNMAPWARDDVIEYLLANHPANCSLIMARLAADSSLARLEGLPVLLQAVIDTLVEFEGLNGIRQAIRHIVRQLAVDEERLGTIQASAAESVLGHTSQRQNPDGMSSSEEQGQELERWIGNRFVRVLLAADHLLSSLTERISELKPPARVPADLVAELATLAFEDSSALQQMQELSSTIDQRWLPLIVSTLFKAQPGWRPNNQSHFYLVGALFAQADWSGIDLSDIALGHADLRSANLSHSNLESTVLHQSNLAGVCATSASLRNVYADAASFCGANLSGADLSKAGLVDANLSRSKLDKANLANAKLVNANLDGASLRQACLARCNLLGATFSDTDLTDAELTGAVLHHADLRTAILRGANLTGAYLRDCNLELVEWPGATLAEADLSGSYLTGARMPSVDLRNANLYGAGLADVDWEGGDLRNANLRHCSFHMGSSRCGLVDSPYPSHGTRTGFYTNDFDEKWFKAPEVIRKANLCGADLRGADVTDADFYLVDLRGALYDRDQAIHFRRCDAILTDPSA